MKRALGTRASELPFAAEAKPRQWGWLVLFASSATLICCALPILLVALGLGAVSAVLFANLPFLETLARHKIWLFTGSGLMLMAAGWTLFMRPRACPADPALAAKCNAAHRWNKRLLAISVAIWIIGFVAAYLSLPLLEFYDRFYAD